MASFFYKDSSDNRYFVGRSLTVSGITYVASAVTEATLSGFGFTKVTVEDRPDARFFVFTGPTVSGTFDKTERVLADVKASLVSGVKKEERNLLAPTDYVIIQNVEDSSTYPIPSDVSTYRANVRAASVTRCNEINAETTITGLAHVFASGLTAFPDSSGIVEYSY